MRPPAPFSPLVFVGIANCLPLGAGVGPSACSAVICSAIKPRCVPPAEPQIDCVDVIFVNVADNRRRRRNPAVLFTASAKPSTPHPHHYHHQQQQHHHQSLGNISKHFPIGIICPLATYYPAPQIAPFWRFINLLTYWLTCLLIFIHNFTSGCGLPDGVPFFLYGTALSGVVTPIFCGWEDKRWPRHVSGKGNFSCVAFYKVSSLLQVTELKWRQKEVLSKIGLRPGSLWLPLVAATGPNVFLIQCT